MYFEIYLDDLLIDEPKGFDDIILNMKRDNNWHGIFFEASATDLTFYGEAANYLMTKKRNDGLRADVAFRALQSCGIYEELETILEGKLNFGKYIEECGNNCSVTILVEQTGCLMTMRNRYDQKVDMNSGIAFDKTTAIEQYNGINFDMNIPARAIDVRTEAFVADEGNQFDLPDYLNLVASTGIRPVYGREIFNSINTGQLESVVSNASLNEFVGGQPMSPQLLYEDLPFCFNQEFTYNIRLRGILNVSQGNNAYIFAKLKFVEFKPTDDPGFTLFADATIIDEFTIVDFGLGTTTFPQINSYDNTFSGSFTPKAGYGYYAFLQLDFELGTYSINNIFDKETYFNISTKKICPDTIASVYAINESLSHVTEAITDGCLKVKSDYYGRTDSEPYASTEDGCGALRILTSGLQIRKAENPVFFASLKDLFDGLKGIDNIGMGIEDNPNVPNAQWLRIEPIEYFYRDEEILSLPFVPDAKKAIQEQLHYSLIKVGYKKWEVENINGLDEFNSNKEFRTGLSSVNNTLDLTSNFIAGGYPWEITRQQSFAETGAADTKYDNDTFIACVERDAYGFHIEQDNIEDAENIFSPETAYNWRIRPFYNLMRWFKCIANSYPNIVDTTNKLFFSSGTGNFLASGELSGAYPTCKLENTQKAENRDLSRTDFVNQADAVPLWKPEYMTFRYPLSVKDYKTIKANPYGYISVQCGTGEYVKGYIQNINYRLNAGIADFTLKLKWV